MKYYHYTSLETFSNMLKRSIKTDKKTSTKYLEIWASLITEMNDTAERELFINEYIKRVKQYAESQNEVLNGSQEKLLNRMGSSEIYVISFSRHRAYDKLDMWRGYGGNGNGICIEFDFNHFQPYTPIYNSNAYLMEEAYLLTKCTYTTPDKIKISKRLIKKTYLDILKGEVSDTKSVVSRAGIMAEVTRQSVKYKHPAYKSEHESRMIVQNIKKKHRRKVRGNKKQYAIQRVPLSTISSITIGPCIKDSESINNIVKIAKRRLGKDININFSEIPYRG